MYLKEIVDNCTIGMLSIQVWTSFFFDTCFMEDYTIVTYMFEGKNNKPLQAPIAEHNINKGNRAVMKEIVAQ